MSKIAAKSGAAFWTQPARVLDTTPRLLDTTPPLLDTTPLVVETAGLQMCALTQHLLTISALHVEVALVALLRPFKASKATSGHDPYSGDSYGELKSLRIRCPAKQVLGSKTGRLCPKAAPRFGHNPGGVWTQPRRLWTQPRGVRGQPKVFWTQAWFFGRSCGLQ